MTIFLEKYLWICILDLDLDIYSADVHMDKIAEVFLFISLCNPLRWHEGKKNNTVQFSTEAA